MQLVNDEQVGNFIPLGVTHDRSPSMTYRFW